VSYEGETVERAIDKLIQHNIDAALSAVEARWTDDDALPIARPRSYSRGYRAFMADLPSSSMPYVVTIVSQAQPQGGSGRLDAQDVLYPFSINAWCVGADEDAAVTVAHRYAEAVVDILEANRVIFADPSRGAGYRQTTDVPQVEIYADNEAHLVDGYKGDIQNSDDVDYLRLVVVSGMVRD
jgi:hypothetical protein